MSMPRSKQIHLPNHSLAFFEGGARTVGGATGDASAGGSRGSGGRVAITCPTGLKL